ncbi:uncharacterized protein LOC129702110 isoform X3 [Leucoraja erinacea]|uniref:uncharacterized protein LOC129702110 isoform X3 n=1 Tax=Leucoraja erinaceus TaxID=7782 RepID=UPI0024564DCA|nr:uncharacterized protein LOC129702110 isoform X3 [Leucoraja erinacea]
MCSSGYRSKDQVSILTTMLLMLEFPRSPCVNAWTSVVSPTTTSRRLGLPTLKTSAGDDKPSGFTIWFGNCSAQEKKALQRVVRSAERTMGTSLATP